MALTKTVVRGAAALALALPLAAAAAPAGGTDADHFGRIGIGFYGISDIPIATATHGGTAAAPTIDNPGQDVSVSAPAVGVRYWFPMQSGPIKAIGVDVAVGLGFSGGGDTTTVTSVGGVTTTVKQTDPSRNGWMVHLGVPFAFASFQNAVFEVIPEFTYGSSSGTIKDNTAPPVGGRPDLKLSGSRLDLGVRAGFEVFFGFMGIPQLALEGTIGLAYTSQQAKVEMGSQSWKVTTSSFTTNHLNDPWDIFRGTVAARYYF